ncbi:hypothetical protein DENSPDRAFT_837648 [Dentipellis sp. KUC8613]|nr:hypothetical protein DENSPDRAFT_837648 [Dentipellis sp. KUC8613]
MADYAGSGYRNDKAYPPDYAPPPGPPPLPPTHPDQTPYSPAPSNNPYYADSDAAGRPPYIPYTPTSAKSPAPPRAPSPLNLPPGANSTDLEELKIAAQEIPGFTYTGKAPPKRDPLSPPPDCLRRPPPPAPALPYTRLPGAIRIPAHGKHHLTSGFEPIFPAPAFLLAHDVRPGDLARLLEDCHLLGKLHPAQYVVGGLAPLVLGVAFIPGFFVAQAINSGFKRRHVEQVGDLVKVWDELFFAPRGLHVWVEKGKAQQRREELMPEAGPSRAGVSPEQEEAIRKEKKKNRDRLFLVIDNR